MTTANDTPAPDREKIVEKICEELAKLPSVTQDLDANTDIAAELNLDSVSVMEMVFALEESYDVAVPLHELGEVRTIAELADTILNLKKQDSSA